MNNISGEYDFGNFTLINPIIKDIGDYRLTVIHEHVHMLLSTQSSTGIVMYCLKRLPLQEADIKMREAVLNFLQKHSIKVQEAMAVFAECTVKLVEDGIEDLENYINDLNRYNQTYYKYLKKLIFILEIMKKEKSKDIIWNTYWAIYKCALYAMNNKIYTLNVELFKSKNTLKKIVTDADFSKNYLPNSRFFALIDRLKNVQNCQEIIKIVNENIKDSIKNNYTLEDYEQRLYEIKRFVLGLFPDIEYYKQSLEKITCKEIEVKDFFNMQLPLVFNSDVFSKYLVKATYDELIPKYKDTMLFILGSIKNTSKQINVDYKNFEQFDIDINKEFILLYSIHQKNIFSALLSSDDVQKLLKNNNSIIVVNYKNYDYKNNEIEGHYGIEKNIFIYCDRTYKNFTSYYDYWKDKNIYYSWLEYEKVLVLVIKIAERRFMLLPVNLAVFNEAQIDVSNRQNMIALEKIEELLCSQIDTVVSYLLFSEVFFGQTIQENINPEYIREITMQ